MSNYPDNFVTEVTSASTQTVTDNIIAFCKKDAPADVFLALPGSKTPADFPGSYLAMIGRLVEFALELYSEELINNGESKNISETDLQNMEEWNQTLKAICKTNSHDRSEQEQQFIVPQAIFKPLISFCKNRILTSEAITRGILQKLDNVSYRGQGQNHNNVSALEMSLARIKSNNHNTKIIIKAMEAMFHEYENVVIKASARIPANDNRAPIAM